MATRPDIESLRALVKRDQEFFHIQIQRLAEIQQSDPETLSDADRNSISSWDKSVIKDCNRQLMMLEEIPAPTVEEREIMQELNKMITLGDHIMEKRNLVHAELNDRINAMKKSNAAKSQPLNKGDTQKKPDSVPTPLTKKDVVPNNNQALDPANLDPPNTAVPSAALPTTTQSSTAVESRLREVEESSEILSDDDMVAFDPKDLYAIMKIDPETETPLVKK
jgi:ribosomal protein L17